MPRESASIVLVGSTAAIFGEAFHGDYSAAKAGMSYGLTNTLKNEIVHLAPLGKGELHLSRMDCHAYGTRLCSRSGSRGAGDSHNALAQDRPTRGHCPGHRLLGIRSPSRSHQRGAVLPVAGGMEGRLLHDI